MPVPTATVTTRDDQDDQPNFDLGFDDFDDYLDQEPFAENCNVGEAAGEICTIGEPVMAVGEPVGVTCTSGESEVINLDMDADGIITIPQSGPPGTVYNVSVPAVQSPSDICNVSETISDTNIEVNTATIPFQNIMANAKFEGCTINFQFKQD
jgi:hypothetical protein